MQRLEKQIEKAQDQLKNQLIEGLKTGPITKEAYGRYLTMQYHLTKGVQSVFMRIASHESLGKRKNLRHWLIQFAEEEEFHFKVAESDLKDLGMTPGSMPLDVQLWWLFFDKIIDSKPFIRLGATFILENISNKSSDLIHEMIKTSSFLTERNSRFIVIHQHGPNLDHGNQIIDNVKAAQPTVDEIDQLVYGAEVATLFFKRYIDYVFKGLSI